MKQDRHITDLPKKFKCDTCDRPTHFKAKHCGSCYYNIRRFNSKDKPITLSHISYSARHLLRYNYTITPELQTQLNYFIKNRQDLIPLQEQYTMNYRAMSILIIVYWHYKGIIEGGAQLGTYLLYTLSYDSHRLYRDKPKVRAEWFKVLQEHKLFGVLLKEGKKLQEELEVNGLSLTQYYDKNKDYYHNSIQRIEDEG